MAQISSYIIRYYVEPVNSKSSINCIVGGLFGGGFGARHVEHGRQTDQTCSDIDLLNEKEAICIYLGMLSMSTSCSQVFYPFFIIVVVVVVLRRLRSIWSKPSPKNFKVKRQKGKPGVAL